MKIEPEFGFHASIREVDLLRSRIAELEDGACRFNCQKERAAYTAGQKNPELSYRQWVKERK